MQLRESFLMDHVVQYTSFFDALKQNAVNSKFHLDAFRTQRFAYAALLAASLCEARPGMSRCNETRLAETQLLDWQEYDDYCHCCHKPFI